MPTTPRVAFYANSFATSTASIRLRCISVMAGLNSLGLMAEPFDSAKSADYDVIVFSKTYDDRARQTCKALIRAGKRTVLDLCDNHFFGEEYDPLVAQRAARLEAMVAIVDRLTVSTETLGNQLQRRYGIAPEKIFVVPDPIEDPALKPPTWSNRLALFSLDRFLSRKPDALRLVWFGNHGTTHAASGMTDLLEVAPVINAAGRARDITLTIISNNRGKYLEVARLFEIGLHYMAWSEGSIKPALRKHDVAIIPITRNPFTVAKSINRPATALMAGLGVIADAIPSYEELRPFIYLDDWAGGLAAYGADRTAIVSSTLNARQELSERYSLEQVSRLWRDVLRSG